jgi:ubiquinone biosynthesis protein UbiJ
VHVTVELGRVGDRSVAATVYGLIDRGVALRPHLAREMDGVVRITFAEGYAAVRIHFAGDRIEVADDAGGEADLEVQAALTDFVLCVSAPLAAGVPKPTSRAGRAALARMADGRVDFSGSLGLGRKLLALMSVVPEKVRPDGS